MTGFDLSNPPRYRFGLFGRRASGKTVYLVALGAACQPETDGAALTFRAALEPDAGPAPNARSLRDIELAYVESVAALSKGRLPSQTDSTDGTLRYAFTLSRPAVCADSGAPVRDLEISDHAGELVNRQTTEVEQTAALHRFLAQRDALILVAEAPRRGDDPTAAAARLAEVNELAQRVAQALADTPPETQGCRTVAVLVTKWDRVAPFDGVQRAGEDAEAFRGRLRQEEARHAALFADWLGTPEAAGHRRLLDDLCNRLGAEAVRAWPVSAFGQADQGTDPDTGAAVEVPAGPQLATLNLVRPLSWLVDRTDAALRRQMLQAATEDDPRHVLAWSNAQATSLPQWSEVRPRFGDDAELRYGLEQVHAQRVRTKRLRDVAIMAVPVLAFVLVSTFAGVTMAKRDEALAQAALKQPALARLADADHRLVRRDGWAPWSPWTVAHRLVLPDDKVARLRAKVAAEECARWRSVLNLEPGPADEARITEFQVRINETPRCDDLSAEVAIHAASNLRRAALSGIERDLDAGELPEAVRGIFDAARDPEAPPDWISDLEATLVGIGLRVEEDVARLENRPDGSPDALQRVTEVLRVLALPPEKLTDSAAALRADLEGLRAGLELRVACSDFGEIYERVVALSRRSGWPTLRQINSLSAEIDRWPAGPRSEFRQATAALHAHVEGLRVIRFSTTRTSGTLEDSLGSTQATLTVTAQGATWTGTIDASRQGEERLIGTLSGYRMEVDLEAAPVVSVVLAESRFLRGSRTWTGTLDAEALPTWEAMRTAEWSVAIDLTDDESPGTGRIRVAFIPETAPRPPQDAGPPAVCGP